METFNCELKSKTPLLEHKMPYEDLLRLLGSKDTKKQVKIALTPRQIAERHAYKNKQGDFVIPLEYVRQAFKNASAEYKISSSSRKSYKAIAAAIFRPSEEFTVLLDFSGKPLKDFEVDIQKATNHLKGAVAACRPRFDRWKVQFSVEIDTDLISEEIALQVLQDAGHRVGLGSFRVSCGGYFGQYEVIRFRKFALDVDKPKQQMKKAS